MPAPSPAERVRTIYEVFFGRVPRPEEEAHWVDHLGQEGHSVETLFDAFLASGEYQKVRRKRPPFPTWHYYSPIVDPDALPPGFNADPNVPEDSLLGLDLSLEEMDRFFAELRPHLSSFRLARDRAEDRRYYWDNAIYSIGDAVILGAMMLHLRPARIIEIGSGHSTALMLDMIDQFGLDTRITCVEPYPTRLKANLRPADLDVVTIHESPVQAVDPSLFEALEPGDILFIDSTHVLKTGSDVCHELFEILPRLKPGVMVHFHDIHYPFEYPRGWILDRRYSWNEVYAVRALLSHSARYRIRYFNHMYWLKRGAAIEQAYGEPVRNPGGGLWVEVMAPPGPDGRA